MHPIIAIRREVVLKSYRCAPAGYVRMFASHQSVAPLDSIKMFTEALINKSNIKRTIKCMQKAPPIGVKLQKNQIENNFAAVLIPICISPSNEAELLFTRRSAQVSRHTRQIAFPGGIRDPTDADYVDCALRETEEEIGLPRSRVEICGTGTLVTPPHTAAIMPVVGLVHNFDLTELKLNDYEVEEAFTIPISKLASPETLGYTQFRTGFSSPSFIVGPYTIWGVTGYLTNCFLNCLLPPELNKIKGIVKYIRPYKPIK